MKLVSTWNLGAPNKVIQILKRKYLSVNLAERFHSYLSNKGGGGGPKVESLICSHYHFAPLLNICMLVFNENNCWIQGLSVV